MTRGITLLVLLMVLSPVVLLPGSQSRPFPGEPWSATRGQCPETPETPLPPETSLRPSGAGAGAEGFPILSDDFAHAATTVLGVGESAETRYALEKGVYVLEVRRPDLVVWSLLEGTYEDVTIQVEARMLEGFSPAASGIIFRYQDDENFYLFTVSNEGMYRLELVEDNRWIPLIPWTPSEAMTRRGPSTRPFASNVLRVDLAHDQVTLFVNGRNLETMVDGTFLRGRAGVAVSTFDERGAVVHFDNLVLSGSGVSGGGGEGGR
ncbi:MAG: hypothetical protein HC884_15035 [Chloroflexaceae bacterium]|nr:hypothetical protein [Chloroflexaceae bacterium]